MTAIAAAIVVGVIIVISIIMVSMFMITVSMLRAIVGTIMILLILLRMSTTMGIMSYRELVDINGG
jgi:hypothetical protein